MAQYARFNLRKETASNLSAALLTRPHPPPAWGTNHDSAAVERVELIAPPPWMRSFQVKRAVDF